MHCVFALYSLKLFYSAIMVFYIFGWDLELFYIQLKQFQTRDGTRNLLTGAGTYNKGAKMAKKTVLHNFAKFPARKTKNFLQGSL